MNTIELDGHIVELGDLERFYNEHFDAFLESKYHNPFDKVNNTYQQFSRYLIDRLYAAKADTQKLEAYYRGIEEEVKDIKSQVRRIAV